jgi:hypothetical protein
MNAKQVLARVRELDGQGKTWAEIEADIKPAIDAMRVSTVASAAFKSEPAYIEYRTLRNAIIEREKAAEKKPVEAPATDDDKPHFKRGHR